MCGCDTASAFWYPQYNARQFQTFAISAVLFLGGGAAAAAVAVANGIGEGGVAHNESASWEGVRRGEGGGQGLGLLAFVPSVCCMAGELGILTTWGLMVQLKRSKVASVA